MYGYLYLSLVYNFFAIKFLLYEKYGMLQFHAQGRDFACKIYGAKTNLCTPRA